jgi:hypothetical protein
MRWPPENEEVQGVLFGLVFGSIAASMLAATGEFGWPLAILIGAGLGLWGRFYVVRHRKGSGQDGANDDERDASTMTRPPKLTARPLAGDASRWEWYAMTLIPLLTVPVLLALDDLYVTLLALLGNSVLLRLLWKRLNSNPDDRGEIRS